MNLKQLADDSYIILNGEIKNILITKENDSKLLFTLQIIGEDWSCNFGGYDLNDNNFNGAQAVIDLISLLDIDNLFECKGKIVRLAAKANEPVTIIGNIIYDKWLDYNKYRVDIEYGDEELTQEIIDETNNIIEDE